MLRRQFTIRTEIIWSFDDIIMNNKIKLKNTNSLIFPWYFGQNNVQYKYVLIEFKMISFENRKRDMNSSKSNPIDLLPF